MSSEIKDRFSNEIKVIKGYVEYIENNFYNRSCEVIRMQGYEKFRILEEYVFFSEDYDEKRNNREILRQINGIIEVRIAELSEILEKKEKLQLPEISKIIVDNDLQDSLCSYIESLVYDCIKNPGNLPYSKLIDELSPDKLKEEVDMVDETTGEKCYDMLSVEDYKNILNYMKCQLYNDEIEDFESELYEYKELQTLYRIFDDYAPINIYRQSFILLLTAFDAVFFDLAREIFTKNFFSIIPLINYEKKFALSDIAKFEKFEEFSSQVIETIIAGKYVADLMEILYKYKKDVFFISHVDRFSEALEIIQRRNLHVHKKGIVDEKYFTKGNGSEFGVQKGEYAVIDDEYFNRAIELLEQIILNFPED